MYTGTVPEGIFLVIVDGELVASLLLTLLQHFLGLGTELCIFLRCHLRQIQQATCKGCCIDEVLHINTLENEYQTMKIQV